jgi:hypothetical protein
MYRINFDEDERTLRLLLTGLWTRAIFDAFAADFRAALRRDGPFVILSDCRGYPVQSSEVGVAWAGLLGEDSAIRSPYAVVAGSMLNKLQAERALTVPTLRVFLDMAEARAWLDECRRALA